MTINAKVHSNNKLSTKSRRRTFLPVEMKLQVYKRIKLKCCRSWIIIAVKLHMKKYSPGRRCSRNSATQGSSADGDLLQILGKPTTDLSTRAEFFPRCIYIPQHGRVLQNCRDDENICIGIVNIWNVFPPSLLSTLLCYDSNCCQCCQVCQTSRARSSFQQGSISPRVGISLKYKGEIESLLQDLDQAVSSINKDHPWPSPIYTSFQPGTIMPGSHGMGGAHCL